MQTPAPPPLKTRFVTRRWRSRGCVAVVAALGACASGPDRGGLADRALDLVGLQTRRPAAEQAKNEAAVPRPQRITLRIHAGDVLNSDAAGRSLSLVAKVYLVNDLDAFLQAPYDAFSGADGVRGATELREIVLTPGRRVEVVETLADDARNLAVVGLFRAPDERRWRFAFDVKTAAVTGITLGAHGCAISVSEGQPLRTNHETMRLAGLRCQ